MKCKVKDCNFDVIAKGYCKKHYAQVRRTGEVQKYNRRMPNPIIVNEKYAIMKVFDREYNVTEVKISLQDVTRVSKHKWHIKDNSYINSHTGGRLHRFILRVPNESILDVDHINGDKLDNTRENLRECTRSQNNMNKLVQCNNTSGCRGVSWSKSNSKWQSRITVNRKTINLGYFTNYEDAVKVRLQAEEKYFGEYNRK